MAHPALALMVFSTLAIGLPEPTAGPFQHAFVGVVRWFTPPIAHSEIEVHIEDPTHRRLVFHLDTTTSDGAFILKCLQSAFLSGQSVTVIYLRSGDKRRLVELRLDAT